MIEDKSLIFITIVFIIGAVTTMTATHEMMHSIEFSGIEKNSEEICFLGIGENAQGGWYEMSYPESENKKVENIKKYSEIRANLFSTFIFLSLMILYFFWLIKTIKK